MLEISLYVGTGIVVLVLLAFLVGFWIPQASTVIYSREISADVNDLFEPINDLKTWPQWSAWSPERMKGYLSRFEGPDSGAGQIWIWKETKYPGRIEIIESEQNQRIVYELSMEMMPDPMVCTISFMEKEGVTFVQWENEVNWGRNPLGRLMGSIFGKMSLMGAMTFGLQSLEARVRESSDPLELDSV